MRFTPNGTAITNLRLSDKLSDDDFLEHKRVITWAELAEVANQCLRQDDFIYTKGYWKTRTWEGQDGREHSRTELTANQIWKVGKDGQFENIMEYQEEELEKMDLEKLGFNETGLEEELPF